MILLLNLVKYISIFLSSFFSFLVTVFLTVAINLQEFQSPVKYFLYFICSDVKDK